MAAADRKRRSARLRPQGPQPFEEVKGEIRQFLVNQKEAKILDSWYDAAKQTASIEYVK